VGSGVGVGCSGVFVGGTSVGGSFVAVGGGSVAGGGRESVGTGGISVAVGAGTSAVISSSVCDAVLQAVKRTIEININNTITFLIACTFLQNWSFLGINKLTPYCYSFVFIVFHKMAVIYNPSISKP
jgi:hypothetical protein